MQLAACNWLVYCARLQQNCPSIEHTPLHAITCQQESVCYH